MSNKLIKTIIVIMLYFCWFTFFEVPLNIFKIQLSNNTMSLYSFVITFLFLVLLFLIYRNDFISTFKKIDKNIIKQVIKNVLVIFVIMILSNVITIGILDDNTISNINNNSLMEISSKNLLSVINLLIFIPIIEEIVFRKNVRNVILNDKFFIVFSGILLSSLYVILQTPSLFGLISSLPYILTNVYLSYCYVKQENIYNNIFSKIIYNLIVLFLWCV